MSLTARKHTRISAAEYLATENDGTWRHEFINGSCLRFYRDIQFVDPSISNP
jgi:hypothetical protein